MALLGQRVVRLISKSYDRAMNKRRAAGRGISLGVLFLATLVFAFAACSSRSPRDPGRMALQLPIGDPLIKVAADVAAPGLSFLSWDTEGGERAATNLLRAGNVVRLQFLADGVWNDAKIVDRRPGSGGDVSLLELEAGTTRLEWRVESIHALNTVLAERGNKTPAELPGSLILTFFALDAKPTAPGSLRLLFPFDPKVTSTTVLPGDWLDDGTFRLPAVLNAPDWGPMLLEEMRGRPLIGRLEGSRAEKIVDLTFDLPEIAPDKPITLSLTPLLLPAPAGLRDTELWLAARRGWLNALQPCARWGEQDKPFSAPPGILGNNVISDPASVSIWFYADQAFFMPEIAPGISLMPLVRRTIDYWLDQRMRRDADGRLTGEITGYWDYGDFLDGNASPLIAAWDYVESMADLT